MACGELRSSHRRWPSMFMATSLWPPPPSQAVTSSSRCEMKSKLGEQVEVTRPSTVLPR